MTTENATPLEILRTVRAFIRQPVTFPGCYPLVLVCADGGTLCAKCARSEYRQISHETRHHLRGGWAALGVDVHWEGAPIECDHCGNHTESAYGDPDDQGGEQ
jgi:hypothetical protein